MTATPSAFGRPVVRVGAAAPAVVVDELRQRIRGSATRATEFLREATQHTEPLCESYSSAGWSSALLLPPPRRRGRESRR